MMSENRSVLLLIGGGALITVLLGFIFVGPAGCTNHFYSWKASAYGSDWLVVQYAVDGSVINHWELHGAAIQNESHSDGIYFTTPHGVVHLSGHYVYVQNPSPEAKDQFLKRK